MHYQVHTDIQDTPGFAVFFFPLIVVQQPIENAESPNLVISVAGLWILPHYSFTLKPSGVWPPSSGLAQGEALAPKHGLSFPQQFTSNQRLNSTTLSLRFQRGSCDHLVSVLQPRETHLCGPPSHRRPGAVKNSRRSPSFSHQEHGLILHSLQVCRLEIDCVVHKNLNLKGSRMPRPVAICKIWKKWDQSASSQRLVLRSNAWCLDVPGGLIVCHWQCEH